MRDFEQAWYFNLINHLWISKRAGYLPHDGQIWRLAGAHSKAFFVKESAGVMACFEVVEIDGQQWIYNQKVLQVLEKVKRKYAAAVERANKANVSRTYKNDVPVLDVAFEVEAFDFEAAFEKLCKIYPRREYSAIAQQYFIECVEKVKKRHEIRRSEAAAYILSRTEIYASKCKFVAGFTKYLQFEVYEQDESMWDTVVPVGNAKQRATADAIDKAFS